MHTIEIGEKHFHTSITHDMRDHYIIYKGMNSVTGCFT